MTKKKVTKNATMVIAGRKAAITARYNRRIASATSPAQVAALKAACTRAHNAL